MPPSRIASLSASIAHHTQIVDEYLTNHSLEHPSFDPTSPVDLNLPPEVDASRSAILNATQELNDLLQGPRELLRAQHHNHLVPVHVISRFDIASQVPLDGSIMYAELAKQLDVDEGALKQVLRMGITHRIFCEREPSVLTHSAASRLLREDKSVAAWVKTRVEDMWPAAIRVADALGKWKGVGVATETAYALSKDGEAFFQVLDRDTQKAETFGKALHFITSAPGYEVRFVVEGFDWKSLPHGATIVDVGGATGNVSFAVSKAYQKEKGFKFIVQDHEDSMKDLDPKHIELGRKEGIAFMSHDFFTPQSIIADIYMIRWCLHNWPDEKCVDILGALVPAMRAGSRLLVVEIASPEVGKILNESERRIRAMDLTMLEVGNSRERSVDEYRALVKRADARFIWRGCKVPDGSLMGVMEWIWEG